MDAYAVTIVTTNFETFACTPKADTVNSAVNKALIRLGYMIDGDPEYKRISATRLIDGRIWVFERKFKIPLDK